MVCADSDICVIDKKNPYNRYVLIIRTTKNLAKTGMPNKGYTEITVYLIENVLDS